MYELKAAWRQEHQSHCQPKNLYCAFLQYPLDENVEVPPQHVTVTTAAGVGGIPGVVVRHPPGLVKAEPVQHVDHEALRTDGVAGGHRDSWEGHILVLQ